MEGIQEGAGPMALGVLNNLSAIYAERNLNNTNTSLQTVLEQLSSGSRINSGADDAAGLSLVNGLEANSSALTQSETNATEGVGLLDVADGALSQVTNLLNRAITLATEASNGTLNSTQESAANQEYQSILAEVNNIGQTTTYNQQRVFNGAEVAIYTGDSSTAGSSIDDLNIRALSESTVGDTGGVMAYSDGQNNVFINLSKGSQNAQSTDALNTGGTTTIEVNYLVKGADGAQSGATTSISVGGDTTYTNTANGMIAAINNAGLGLSASFATQAQAGVAGGGTQTGIQISGGLVSVGVDPSATSTSGTLDLTGTSANSLLTQGQSVSIQTGAAASISVTVTPDITSLSDLANAINQASAANVHTTGTQVVATVVTTSAGTSSLSLTDANANGGPLSVTVTPGSYVPAITAATVTMASDPVSLSFASGTDGTGGTAGTHATATLGITGTNAIGDALSGAIVLTNGNGNVTFTMNNAVGTDNANHVYLSAANSTLAGMAAAINGSAAGTVAAAATLGASAIASGTGLSLTSSTTGTTISAVGSPTLMSTPILTLQSSEPGASSNPGFPGITVLNMAGGNGYNAADTLSTGSSIVITNNTVDSPGTPITFVVGGNIANDNTAGHLNTYYTGAGNLSIGNLLGVMQTPGTGGTAAGIGSAVVNNVGQIVLTSSNVGATLNAVSGLVDTPAVTPGAPTAAMAATPSGGVSLNAAVATNIVEDANNDPIFATGNDALSGSIVLSNGASGLITFTMDNGVYSSSAAQVNLTTAESNLTGLMNAIDGVAPEGASVPATALDLTATMNATNTGLVFSTAETGTSIGVTSAGLNDVSGLSFTNPVSGNLAGQHASGVVALTDGGMINDAAAGTFNGSLIVTDGGQTETFTMGNAGVTTYAAGNHGTVNVQNNSLANLVTAINTEIGTNAGFTVSASEDPASGGIFVQSTVAGVSGLTAVTTGLTDTLAETPVQGTQGVPVAVPAQVIFGSGTHNLGTDSVSGDIVLQNTGHGAKTTFTMGGAGAGNESGLGTGAVLVNGSTMNALIQAIDDASNTSVAGVNAGNSLDFTATMASNGSGLVVTSTDPASVINANVSTSALLDAYSAEPLTPTPGQASTSPTYASAIVGTGQAVNGENLSGAIVLNNGGGAGSNVTFTMGLSSAGNTAANITTTGETLENLATAISQSGLGLDASVVGGALQLQSNNPDTTITVAGTPTLTDAGVENFVGGAGTAGHSGIPPSASNASVNLAGALTTAQPTDVITGSITLTGTGGPEVFTMGGASSAGTIAVGTDSSDETLQALATAITDDTSLGIDATPVGTGLTFAMSSDISTAIVGTSSLNDTMGYVSSSATLGSFRSESDTLSNGTISFTMGGSATPTTISTDVSSETVQQLVEQIDQGSYGVVASFNVSSGDVILTSNTYGRAGNISGVSSNISDTTEGEGLSYTWAGHYNIGLSNSSPSTALYDASTQSAPNGASAAYENFVASTGGSTGVATMSYSDGAGQSLSATDLSNQTDAETALNDLNMAIMDVAAQDGYIGAQINTLDSVSQVMTTQQENVVSAQNAIQATDYASATSNMSKYEILSQTGIAALAQANSVQQEVTKLLQ
jgi:flagellin